MTYTGGGRVSVDRDGRFRILRPMFPPRAIAKLRVEGAEASAETVDDIEVINLSDSEGDFSTGTRCGLCFTALMGCLFTAQFYFVHSDLYGRECRVIAVLLLFV